jgi:hypothetical protein
MLDKSYELSLENHTIICSSITLSFLFIYPTDLPQYQSYIFLSIIQQGVGGVYKICRSVTSFELHCWRNLCLCLSL